ncbi:adaptor protein MecA [Neobacillus terrae]|uniref:adaptor protein MecA n=1 Tax=Neobacillus terrae TaxID=3034837 RepID=UPI00140D302C|nr:adaptor protein MecA [Neobacillus terrae]NHM29098.1 adaptor protein [Neobacillus terrae]
MRLERLTANKIKISLSSDDLFERGLSKEDIWKDSIKWHQLFHDMLEEASEEFDVDFEGSVGVEIFSLQAQGMIMIITVDDASDEEILYDGFIEMQVRLEGCDDLLFIFQAFEDVICLCKSLDIAGIKGGNLYSINNQYFYHLQKKEGEDLEKAAAILAEYGDASIVSPHWLEEYGKLIVKNTAVETILQYFK